LSADGFIADEASTLLSPLRNHPGKDSLNGGDLFIDLLSVKATASFQSESIYGP
jgi:hypothetical protein